MTLVMDAILLPGTPRKHIGIFREKLNYFLIVHILDHLLPTL